MTPARTRPTRSGRPRRRGLTGTMCIMLVVVACGESPSDPGEGDPGPAPTVAMVTPVDGALFRAGDTVAVSLAATPGAGHTIAPDSVSWWAVLHHGTHTHPFVPPTTGSSGSIVLPTVGHIETSIFYRFYGRAVDDLGRADTVFADLPPELVSVQIGSAPSGLTIVVDGQPRVTPWELSSVVGVEHTIEARSPTALRDSVWTFQSWDHGGDRAQTFAAPPLDTALVANYTGELDTNVPPTVVLTAPSDGDSVQVASATSIEATAADSDGTVETVAFSVDGTVIGSDDAAPFSIDWTPTQLGTYAIAATALDNGGREAVSDTIQVVVHNAGGADLSPPTLTITGPSAGTLGLVGAVSVTADASDDVGVTEVEFQVDAMALGSDTEAPYQATLPATSDYASGAHTFRARARDAAGNWSEWDESTVTFGGGVALPAGFTRSTYASGFNTGGLLPLTAGAFAPDGRLFVLEIQGQVRVVQAGGTLLPTPFATLPALEGGERGLLGIAFHPDFTSNQYVYVYYTYREGGVTRNRISRLTADGDVAVPGSEVVLVELEPLSAASNHNGGAMAFGPDGMLYVAVGDNAQPALSQSLSSRFGKILRYNPDGSIPSDNPFVGVASGEFEAIWATGLRNPFTFAFDGGTGRMYINDVGQDLWEEVNEGMAGADYGWPTVEGPSSDPAFEAPVIAYGHFNSPTLYNGFSIVGAAFYDAPAAPFGEEYRGDYFFADYVSGWIYRMSDDRPGVAYAFANVSSGADLINLLVGPDGALYMLVAGRVDRISR